MFTRVRLPSIVPSNDWAKDAPNFIRWISDYFRSLEGKNVLSIRQAEIYADQGLQFPAIQVSSTDANNLDDYAEVSTAPTPTAGSGSFASAVALVVGTKVGNRFHYSVTVTIATNGTAATSVVVPMPYSPAEVTSASGNNQADNTALTARVGTGGNMVIWKYDGTYPGRDSAVLKMSGGFRV